MVLLLQSQQLLYKEHSLGPQLGVRKSFIGFKKRVFLKEWGLKVFGPYCIYKDHLLLSYLFEGHSFLKTIWSS